MRSFWAVPAIIGLCIGWQGSSQAGPKDAPRVKFLNTLGYREQGPAWTHTSQFSRDGKLAVVAGGSLNEKGNADGTLTVWDVEQGKISHEWKIPDFEVNGLAISRDSKLAVAALSALRTSSVLSVYNLETGKKLFPDSADVITWSLAISPDKKHALSGSRGELQLWNLKNGKLVKRWDAHEKSEIGTVAFRSDSELLSSGDDNRLIFWDLQGKQLRKLDAGHAVLSYSLSGDGNLLATLARDQTIKIWDLKTGKARHTIKKESQGNGVGTVALTTDGKRLLAVQHYSGPAGANEESAITFWDANNGKELWSVKYPFRGIVPIHINADGKQALVGGGANFFSVWNLDDGKLLRTFGGHKGAITGLAVDAEGNIFSASLDHTVKMWAPDGKEVLTYSGHDGPVHAVALSRDGQHLLAASGDKTLKLWDAGTGKEIRTFRGHQGSVTSLAFSPGGKLAVSGGEDRTVKLWNVQTGRVLKTLRGHGDRVNAVAFSPNSDWLASAADDNTIRLWPLKKAAEDAEVKVLEGHKRQVTCLAFSPDGKRLLSGSQDQTLKVWDVAEGEIWRTLHGHKNWVTGLAFPGAKLAASTADDLTVRLWDPATGKEIDRIDVGQRGEVGRCLAFSPDGSTVAVGTAGWVIFRYRLGK